MEAASPSSAAPLAPLGRPLVSLIQFSVGCYNYFSSSYLKNDSYDLHKKAQKSKASPKLKITVSNRKILTALGNLKT